MGAVDTTYTFTATDTITSTKMNNIIDQTTMTSDAIIGTTLDVASGKLKVRSSGITSNELASGSVTSTAIADGTIVNADINASAAIDLSKLATGELPTAITIASANIVDGTIVASDLADASITAPKLDGAQTGTAPIFGCRAWVNFDATKDSTGTVSSANTNRLIRASGNVTSVLKTSNGVYTVTFTTALPDENFAVYGSVSDNGGTTGSTTNQVLNGYQASSSTATITTTTTASNLADYSHVSVCVMR